MLPPFPLESRGTDFGFETFICILIKNKYYPQVGEATQALKGFGGNGGVESEGASGGGRGLPLTRGAMFLLEDGGEGAYAAEAKPVPISVTFLANATAKPVPISVTFLATVPTFVLGTNTDTATATATAT